MKYSEDIILKDIQSYIENTYGGHYVGKDQVQIVDLWASLGNVDTTARDVAMKYLMRYGKKDGYNEKDLLKAIHYIVMMIHFRRKDETHSE
tara:strand:+ start:165 stop:437 length:273 start_codon:yes stop_codon:yes gene_type:complete